MPNRELDFPLPDGRQPLPGFRLRRLEMLNWGTFCSLDWKGLTVIITENKMRTTFLTLPAAPNTLGIWGGGGAAELLTSVNWLAGCRLLYWGDIDVHGFHIVSRLRRAFPNLASVLMNEATLDAFQEFIVTANEASYEEISNLTPEEHRAYQRVRAGKLLLEQEKIPHAHAVHMLSSLTR
jgi:hypothetical protein